MVLLTLRLPTSISFIITIPPALLTGQSSIDNPHWDSCPRWFWCVKLKIKANHHIRDRTVTTNMDRKQITYPLTLKITHDVFLWWLLLKGYRHRTMSHPSQRTPQGDLHSPCSYSSQSSTPTFTLFHLFYVRGRGHICVIYVLYGCVWCDCTCVHMYAEMQNWCPKLSLIILPLYSLRQFHIQTQSSPILIVLQATLLRCSLVSTFWGRMWHHTYKFGNLNFSLSHLHSRHFNCWVIFLPPPPNIWFYVSEICLLRTTKFVPPSPSVPNAPLSQTSICVCNLNPFQPMLESASHCHWSISFSHICDFQMKTLKRKQLRMRTVSKTSEF